MIRAIADHLRFQARVRPHAPAVFDAAGPVSFERLRYDVAGLATELLSRGLTSRDMVGVQLSFTYAHLVALLALDRLDVPSMSFATDAPVASTAASLHRLTAIIGRAAPAEPPCRWIALPAEARPRFAQPDRARLGQIVPAGDPIMRVTWTSGTTGTAKGSPMTRAVQELRLISLRVMRGLGPGTRYLLGMPLSSGYAYAMALAVLSAGGAIVLPDPAVDAAVLANSLRVTATGATPAMLENLVGGDGATRRFETVRFFDVTGALLTSRVAREARLALTPNLWSIYGSTEGGWAAVGDSALCIAQPGAVGHVLPWFDAEIVDADDRALAAGAEGRVRLRSPQIVMSYYQDPEGTAQTFRDGWFYTGDLGRLDADGLLHVTGRVEDAIHRGDRVVSPLPIEEVLRGLTGVRDVAVFALANAAGAEDICAALVLDEGADIAHIRSETATQLGGQAPTRLFIIDRLPRNPNGKVVRRELVAMAQRSAGTLAP